MQGRPLPITIGTAKDSKPLIYTIDDLNDLRQRLPRVSNQGLLNVCSWLNEKRKGQVEVGFQQKHRKSQRCLKKIYL